MSQKKTVPSQFNQMARSFMARDVTAAAFSASQAALNLGSPKDILAMSVNPEDFIHPESFRKSYWAVEMWSKFPFPIQGVDREQVARKSFLDAEQQCAATNQRLAELFSRSDVPESIRGVLVRARRRLERLFAGFTVDEIARYAQWGPGSTTSLPARFATPQNKWVFASHYTNGVIPYIEAFVGYSGWDLVSLPCAVMGNMVTFVPKNAKTDRSIAIEPDWNMFFQLGLGGAIRARLQRWGLLWPIAQQINQNLARKGSSDGFLATIDLKAASDTISLALVEALLPDCVLPHVLALRSTHGSLDGGKTWFPYEKVSSMGNGFTFELETALFWAIASESAGHAMCYGDDLIVPSSTVGWVVTVLNYCGFTVNEKKSHYGTSSFRESCGGHYFLGVDVSPVYVQKPLRGIERLAFANNLSAAMRDQCIPYLQPVHQACKRGVPRFLFGPPSVDGVLHTAWDEASPRWYKSEQTYEGFRLVRRYRSEVSLQLGGLRAALFSRNSGRGFYQREPGVPRDMVTIWRSDEWAENRSPPRRRPRRH